jgi:hypothetical protein
MPAWSDNRSQCARRPSAVDGRCLIAQSVPKGVRRIGNHEVERVLVSAVSHAPDVVNVALEFGIDFGTHVEPDVSLTRQERPTERMQNLDLGLDGRPIRGLRKKGKDTVDQCWWIGAVVPDLFR